MSLTAANAVITLTIPPLFTTPQQLQNFGVDDVYDTPQIKSVEVMMGVDGILSSGFVFVPIPQTITLKADSASIALFDIWWQQMQAAQDTFSASGLIRLPGLGKKYIMNVGSLTGYKPTAAAKKLLQDQSYEITWQSIFPAPL